MANPKRRRSTAELARDRRRMADLYLRGWLQVDIAAELGVSQACVSRDLKFLHEEWRKSALVDIDAARAKEIARVDALDRTYWQAWIDSMGDKESRVTEKVRLSESERVKQQIRNEARLGDPRYLRGVEWCIMQRVKLLGLEKVENIVTLKGDKDAPVQFIVGGGIDLDRDI